MGSQYQPSKPPHFGEPEKTNWRGIILVALFAVVAFGVITYMIIQLPREKQLVCRSDVPTSLTGWGSCTEE